MKVDGFNWDAGNTKKSREIEGRNLIRPISARYMHKKEARKYEEAFAKNEK